MLNKINQALSASITRQLLSYKKASGMMLGVALVLWGGYPVEGYSVVTLDSKGVTFKSTRERPTCVITTPDVIDFGEITVDVDDVAPKVEHIYHPDYILVEYLCESSLGVSGAAFWLEMSSPGAPWATVSAGGATFVKMNSDPSSDISLYIGLIYDTDEGPYGGGVLDNDINRTMALIYTNTDPNKPAPKKKLCGVNGGTGGRPMECYFNPVVKLVKDSSKTNGNRSQKMPSQKNNGIYEQIITFSIVYQ